MKNDAPTCLEVEDVCLSRGGVEVLSHVSCGFPRHRLTVMTGPSGAGKTSLLRCLNRLEEPERGRIRIDGTDVRDIAPVLLRRRVGMIFQIPVIFPGTVRSNLSYGLEQAASDEVFETSLETVALNPSFLDRASSALSLGEAQRVCLARALVRDPEVILMDEPTSALDEAAAGVLEETFRALVERGLTAVVVTHNREQARRLADHMVLMQGGRVVASGSPENVLNKWPRREPA